jgi:hypothetical protein
VYLPEQRRRIADERPVIGAGQLRELSAGDVASDETAFVP